MTRAPDAPSASARAPPHPPGVLHMLDLVLPPTHIPDRQHVESVRIPHAPMPKPPQHGHLAQLVALEHADRFDRPSTDVRAPGLDLDERHEVPSADDEIEIVPPQAEAVRLHVPAAGGEVRDGRTLSRESSALALVGPPG